MQILTQYIEYIRWVRRYSERTVSIYESILRDYVNYAFKGKDDVSENELIEAMNRSEIRGYEVYMMETDPPHSPKTISLHLSALSGFCRFLMQKGKLKSNPVKLVPKPKIEKRIPQFFRKEALDAYFDATEYLFNASDHEAFLAGWHTDSGKKHYKKLLARMIISTLYTLGVRRSELISLKVGDVDFGRKVVKVHGKGDKMREIPLIPSLSEEILLYLNAVEMMCGGERSLKEPLFVTYDGKSLYPVYVDRAVKSEFGDVKEIKGRKSPHVLRHSLATELMNEGVDLNSIKELLGHSSLATTQVYTHSSIARLKTIYEHAHPRAKNGGKNGD